MARLGAECDSINISKSFVTHSKLRNELQIQGKTEGSLLLPIHIVNNSHDEGTVPGASVSLNLYLQILDSSQYITIRDEGQHYTRMRCTGDIPFTYNEQKGSYTIL